MTCSDRSSTGMGDRALVAHEGEEGGAAVGGVGRDALGPIAEPLRGAAVADRTHAVRRNAASARILYSPKSGRPPVPSAASSTIPARNRIRASDGPHSNAEQDSPSTDSAYQAAATEAVGRAKTVATIRGSGLYPTQVYVLCVRPDLVS